MCTLYFYSGNSFPHLWPSAYFHDFVFISVCKRVIYESERENPMCFQTVNCYILRLGWRTSRFIAWHFLSLCKAYKFGCSDSTFKMSENNNKQTHKQKQSCLFRRSYLKSLCILIKCWYWVIVPIPIYIYYLNTATPLPLSLEYILHPG